MNEALPTDMPVKFKKALIIDDDEVNNYLAEQFIAMQEVSEATRVAPDGAQALEYLESCHAEDDFPDLILVDISLPVMDGFAFIEAYEARFWKKRPGTVLVVVTSSVREADGNRARSYGSVRAFFSKPVTDFRQFLDLIG